MFHLPLPGRLGPLQTGRGNKSSLPASLNLPLPDVASSFSNEFFTKALWYVPVSWEPGQCKLEAWGVIISQNCTSTLISSLLRSGPCIIYTSRGHTGREINIHCLLTLPRSLSASWVESRCHCALFMQLLHHWCPGHNLSFSSVIISAHADTQTPTQSQFNKWTTSSSGHKQIRWIRVQ